MKFSDLTLISLIGAWMLASYPPQVSAAENLEDPIERPLAQALAKAGKNRKTLESAIAESTPELKASLEFLIRYMPRKDLETLNKDYLLENVRLAHQARTDTAWANEVPIDLFLNDVLPYASLDVRRDPWRADFYRRFSPLVKDCQTLREAATVINQSIRNQLKVDYSTKRKKPNQSPFESIDSGIASCSGLSILLCNAFRSVGIPARIAGIPAWPNKPGNHNWVEFYDPKSKSWHFCEYYPDPKGFDHAWFLQDAALADPTKTRHSIFATSWKTTGISFPLVWDRESKTVPGINVTERYLELAKKRGIPLTSTHQLRVEFRKPNGVREPIKVTLIQGEKPIAQGTTPSEQADQNEFLTFEVEPSSSYRLEYLSLDGTAKQRDIPSLKGDKPPNFQQITLP